MPDYADCLAAWLKVVGAERPHVLGLSWGSSVALKLYRRHPQVPASLILASAYAGWAGSLPPEEVNARLASVLDTFPVQDAPSGPSSGCPVRAIGDHVLSVPEKQLHKELAAHVLAEAVLYP